MPRARQTPPLSRAPRRRLLKRHAARPPAHPNNRPGGRATRRPVWRAPLPVEDAAARLGRFLRSSVELMQILARACGHTHLGQFSAEDLTTFDRDMAALTGVRYGGVGS